MKSHVILCCHNGEKFIREQISSILIQQTKIDKIHVFDFMSSDRTVEIVNDLRAQAGDGVIQLCCYDDAPGASLSFFRAFGVILPLLAMDDYVYLCDQDDVWTPRKTSVITPLIEAAIAADADRPALLFHDVRVVDSELRTISPSFYTGNPFKIPRDLRPDRLLLSNPAIGHTMVVSRPLLALVDHWATKDRYLMHDWCLLLFTSRFGTIRFVSDVLSLYRQHDANILGAFRSRSIAGRVRRTRRFATRVIVQVDAFVADMGRLRGRGTSDAMPTRYQPGTDRWLAPHPLIRQLQLAALALTSGPTLLRRGLALFILTSRPPA